MDDHEVIFHTFSPGPNFSPVPRPAVNQYKTPHFSIFNLFFQIQVYVSLYIVITCAFEFVDPLTTFSPRQGYPWGFQGLSALKYNDGTSWSVRGWRHEVHFFFSFHFYPADRRAVQAWLTFRDTTLSVFFFVLFLAPVVSINHVQVYCGLDSKPSSSLDSLLMNVFVIVTEKEHNLGRNN